MNWKLLISELNMPGRLTQTQIATECGCKQATIWDIANGKTPQPRYDVGQKLIALHKKEVLRRKPVEAKAGA